MSSIFEDQIQNRKNNDDQLFQQAFDDLLSVISKRNDKNEASQEVSDAVENIFDYYKIKNTIQRDEEFKAHEYFEIVLRHAGMTKRRVELKDDWYKNVLCPIITTHKNGSIVALIPTLSGRYFYKLNGKKIKITKQEAKNFNEDAFCFFRPFPQTKLGFKDLLLYLLNCVTYTDIAWIMVVSFLVTVIGMFMPLATKLVYDYVIPSGKISSIFPVACFLVGVYIAQSIANIAKTMANTRFNEKISYSVQNANIARLFSMPANFFKKYSSGELLQRSLALQDLLNILKNTILDLGIAGIFSLIYIVQMFAYAPSMVIPGIIAIVIQMIFSLMSIFLGLKISKKEQLQNAKLSGLVYEIISGVCKIKLAGAEKRVFSKWANQYAQYGKTKFQKPLILSASNGIAIFVTGIGTLLLYWSAGISNVSLSDYMAFSIAYASVTTAFMSLLSMATSIASIKPIWQMAEPILSTLPETAGNKKIVTHISGAIEVTNLTFRYSKELPPVIDGLNLRIKSGEYVAIVGKTGCGKSTLMRLLLGFEQPELGAIYYDGNDLAQIDTNSLRMRVGVNLQDGKLFAGDLFSNIIITAPWKTLDDAWEAAKLACFDEDIRRLPMGMNTIVSEGGGGFSGGQRQRILIARALVSMPKLLIFDEATSALDNVTQRIVSENIDKLKCTRIVIAHRLSTIRQCDRVIMLDNGKIVEEGSFDKLMEKQGAFYELVQKQTV